MKLVSQFIEAARFLTRVPFPSTGDKTLNLSEAFVMFPVVGARIGAFSGVLFWVALIIGLPSFLAAVIAIGGTIILTGALHEDGLGDVADGFGGGKTREQKLNIMRDSRVGSYGVLCLSLMVAARLGVLIALSDTYTPLAILLVLMAGAAVSRGSMVGIVSHLPPARVDGLAASLSPSQANTMLTYAVALAIALVVMLPVMTVLSAAIAVISAVVATILFAALALRQIGGQTGDVAGAAQQIAEIFFLMAVVALI